MTRACRQAGASLAELTVAVGLIAIGLTVALPSLATIATAGRGAAGARQLATTFQALRWKSVTQRMGHGLLFERDPRGWVWREVRDGNGNGLRTAEVRGGVDPAINGPYRLEEQVEHVNLGFPPGGPFPRIPPGRGTIDSSDPVQFGRSDLVAFSPLGTSSSGTLYLTDGRHGLFAVVLFGRTAKIRVWRYDTRTGRWTL